MKKIHKFLVMFIACTMLFSLCACNLFDDEPPTPTYTIQYTDDFGIHTIEGSDGMTYSLDKLPSRVGYDFMGLYDSETGGTQYVLSTGLSLSAFTDKKNIVLFPQFRAKEYTLILDYQGATVTGSRSIKVAYDSEISELPMNLIMENHVFKGWYTEPNCNGKQIADSYGVLPENSKVSEKLFDLSDPNGYIKLYAGFKLQEYTVTFYADTNSAPINIKVEHGAEFNTIAPNIKVNNKMVISWSKMRNDVNKLQIYDSPITSDIILYAAEYAPFLEFDTNGGNNISPIMARTGDTVSLPTPTKANYKFIGWQTQEGKLISSITMPEDSIRLVAQWQAMIIFDSNGGAKVSDISEPQGTNITLPISERVGYIFVGWYDIKGAKYENTIMPSESKNLIARYNKIENKRIVVISESKTAHTHFYSDYSPNKPTVSRDEAYFQLDVGDIVAAGVNNVKITAHYSSRAYENTSLENPVYTHMAWYSEKTVSEAYKVWDYADKHTNNDYENYVRNTTLSLTTSKLYICIYSTGNVGWNGNRSRNQYWTNFWVEIEYQDMSTLY